MGEQDGSDDFTARSLPPRSGNAPAVAVDSDEEENQVHLPTPRGSLSDRTRCFANGSSVANGAWDMLTGRRHAARGGDFVDDEAEVEEAEEAEEAEGARGGTGRGRSDDEDEDEDEDEEEDEHEHEGGSDTGVQRLGERRSKRPRTDPSSAAADNENIFVVPGVDCVGCLLANHINPVTRFVSKNLMRIERNAMWKLAAVVYENEVVAERRREGIAAPAWSWKSIRNHYELHTKDIRLTRLDCCNTLQAMRMLLKDHLVRVEDDSDERELDRATSEQMLKLIALESKELQLLNACTMAGPAAKASASRGRAAMAADEDE